MCLLDATDLAWRTKAIQHIKEDFVSYREKAHAREKARGNLHNCSQTKPKRPRKCSHGTKLFIQFKVPFSCIDFANHLSCTSKTVKIDPKTSMAGRSTGI